VILEKTRNLLMGTVTKLQPKRCPVCGRPPKRSSEANRRYWALINAIAANLDVQGIYYSADSWHLYMKQRYLGADDVTLPNGKTIIQPKSTADLETAEFCDYMQQVEIWGHEHGIYLDE
jgi:hypothetical protein